jgi:hypothetical protein
MLFDRLPERAALSGLLDAARAGRSGVLVMRGEPGAGKTALLDWVIESAAGLLPRFPHDKAQHRRSRGSAKPDAHPGSSHGALGYPAGYPLADHDCQPWRMRTGAPRT